MSKFKIESRPTVDENALHAFAEAADNRSMSYADQPKEKATEAFLLRLTPTQARMLDAVFQQSTIKSKQKLVTSILMPNLEEQFNNLQGKP
jgi:hypothetical protein